jgi:hypothetical protein
MTTEQTELFRPEVYRPVATLVSGYKYRVNLVQAGIESIAFLTRPDNSIISKVSVDRELHDLNDVKVLYRKAADMVKTNRLRAFYEYIFADPETKSDLFELQTSLNTLYQMLTGWVSLEAELEEEQHQFTINIENDNGLDIAYTRKMIRTADTRTDLSEPWPMAFYHEITICRVGQLWAITFNETLPMEGLRVQPTYQTLYEKYQPVIQQAFFSTPSDTTGATE